MLKTERLDPVLQAVVSLPCVSAVTVADPCAVCTRRRCADEFRTIPFLSSPRFTISQQYGGDSRGFQLLRRPSSFPLLHRLGDMFPSMRGAPFTRDFRLLSSSPHVLFLCSLLTADLSNRGRFGSVKIP
jgi:hypothetical protein